jgi:hypothetical protein
MEATHIVTADRDFVKAMRHHPDLSLATMLLSLDQWARNHGI